jgi:hypothetical protein
MRLVSARRLTLLATLSRSAPVNVSCHDGRAAGRLTLLATMSRSAGYLAMLSRSAPLLLLAAIYFDAPVSVSGYERQSQ